MRARANGSSSDSSSSGAAAMTFPPAGRPACPAAGPPLWPARVAKLAHEDETAIPFFMQPNTNPTAERKYVPPALRKSGGDPSDGGSVDGAPAIHPGMPPQGGPPPMPGMYAA